MSRGWPAEIGRVVLLMVVAVALQTLIVSRVSVLGVTADLFLILTVVTAIGRGSLYGAVFGFAAGVVADIAFLEPLGVRALIYVLMGYMVGSLVHRFTSVNLWGVFLLAACASFVAQVAYGLFQYAIGPRAGFFVILTTQVLPETVLDALVTVPIYVLLIRLRVVPAPHAETAAAGVGQE
ncbi:MAG: rod shape-determining protein MreD [Actinobacteria bacterium]|jgi:rod shape-determining protein MreD|nr:rod shape-determining protein MreD [Actinomycetota bacterium]